MVVRKGTEKERHASGVEREGKSVGLMHQNGRYHPNNDLYLKVSFLGVKVVMEPCNKYNSF